LYYWGSRREEMMWNYKDSLIKEGLPGRAFMLHPFKLKAAALDGALLSDVFQEWWFNGSCLNNPGLDPNWKVRARQFISSALLRASIERLIGELGFDTPSVMKPAYHPRPYLVSYMMSIWCQPWVPGAQHNSYVCDLSLGAMILSRKLFFLLWVLNEMHDDLWQIM
jgi:hypothetical protein